MTTRSRLSLQDSIFLIAEKRETPMHVGGLQIFRIPHRAPAHFVACPDAVPSMQRLALHMDAAMDELEATFGGRRAPRRKQASSRGKA